MSNTLNDPESLEEGRIVCAHCGKEIRYERPHFCPHCGKEIDSTQGLELATDEAEIYPTSNFAPLLMRIFLWWILIAFIATAIFGRTALILTTTLFVLIALVLGLSSFVSRTPKDKP